MQTEKLYQYYQQHPVVSTDSRRVGTGDIFFALKGENFDGNKYAAAALEAGAGLAVVDDPNVANSDKYILVDDVLKQLQDLARFHRRKMTAPVLAITGSNGKTTTKELVHAVLNSQYQAYATQGNYNNHIGVPLTLLSIPLSAEVLVIEMGANHQKEIAELCKIAEPSHGLITNIGRAHLEGFGGIEGVKKGKGELFDWLKESNGVAFVNMDADHLMNLSIGLAHPIYYSGEYKTDDIIWVEKLASHPKVKARFHQEDGDWITTNSQLAGQHNFSNIMTAIVIGKYFKVPDHKIKTSIESYLPQNNRSQVMTKDGVNYLVDAYNANEDSMTATLNSFYLMTDKPKIAFLGDMLELGEEAPATHMRVATLAQKLMQETILVGPHFAAAAKALQLRHFEHINELKSWFSNQDWVGKYILLKGSRAMRMEDLLSV